MTRFQLRREAQTDRSTLGRLFGPEGEDICFTLERGARNADHPRIPAGEYALAIKTFGSSRFDETLRDLIGSGYVGIVWLPSVFGRSDIEIHPANFISELRGCIAPGLTRDRDSAGDWCVFNSRHAYSSLYSRMTPSILGAGAQLSILDI